MYKVVWRANHRWKHWENQDVKERGQTLEFESLDQATDYCRTKFGERPVVDW